MRTLHAKLILGLSASIVVVLAAAAWLSHASIARVLRAEFDEALAQRARALSTLVELDESGLSFELDELPSPENAAERARRNTLELEEQYQIWRADGTTLARSESLGGNDLERPDVAPGAARITEGQADGARTATATYRFEPRTEFEAGAAVVSAPVTISVRRSLRRLDAALANIRNLFFAVAPLTALLASGIVYLVVRRSLRPLTQLGARISDIGPAALCDRIDLPELPTELRPIVSRLNGMLERLEHAFERERRFTADAAHELRTPLAGLRAKIELALSRERSPDAYRAALDDCLAIERRTERIIESLLELARADAGQTVIDRRPTRLPELLEDRWREFADAAATRKIAVEWSVPVLPEFETDDEKLALVVRNLFENAVEYVEEGGRISIVAELGHGDLRLRVTNTGSLLSADEAAQAGRRFWRGPSAKGRRNSSTHSGLGLALAMALAIALGGDLVTRQPVLGQFQAELRVPLHRSSHNS